MKKSFFAWKGDVKTLKFLLNVKPYVKSQRGKYQRARLA